jgi:hypothetical protein
MFKLLKEKLILLYTLTTGLILIIVIVIILMLTERQLESKKLDAFQININTIINKLQFENEISHTWLSQMEANNHLLIYIEDNGASLTFPGAVTAPTDRRQLLDQLNKLVLKENINIDIYPIFSSNLKSSIFAIKGIHREAYYGCTVIIPTSFGWRSLSLLKYLPNNNTSIWNQRFIFSFLGLIGILAFYVVIRCFVSKMLKPIEEFIE